MSGALYLGGVMTVSRCCCWQLINHQSERLKISKLQKTTLKGIFFEILLCYVLNVSA